VIDIGGLKNKLGLCCSNGCYHKAKKSVNLEEINIKRKLCNKHFLEFDKFTEDFIRKYR